MQNTPHTGCCRVHTQHNTIGHIERSASGYCHKCARSTLFLLRMQNIGISNDINERANYMLIADEAASVNIYYRQAIILRYYHFTILSWLPIKEFESVYTCIWHIKSYIWVYLTHKLANKTILSILLYCLFMVIANILASIISIILNYHDWIYNNLSYKFWICVFDTYELQKMRYKISLVQCNRIKWHVYNYTQIIQSMSNITHKLKTIVKFKYRIFIPITCGRCRFAMCNKLNVYNWTIGIYITL